MSYYNHTTAYSSIPGSSSGPFHPNSYSSNSPFHRSHQKVEQQQQRTAYDSRSAHGSAFNHGQMHDYPSTPQHPMHAQQHKPANPPHMRPNSMSYKQFTAPPQHPAQRERSRSRSPNRGQAQPAPSYIQTHPNPPPNTYVHASAPSTYGGQQLEPLQPYESPYSGSSSGAGVSPIRKTFDLPTLPHPNAQAMSRDQALRQAIPPTALFLQSIYNPPQPQRPQVRHRPMSMHIPSQPVPPTAFQPLARTRSSTLLSQPPISFQQPASQFSAPIQHTPAQPPGPLQPGPANPTKFPTSIAGVGISSSPPKSHAQPAPQPGIGLNPIVGARRPLPTPGSGPSPGRSRPMSMPPQSFSQPPSAFSSPHSQQQLFGHKADSSISSLQSIIDRPSNLQKPNVQVKPRTSPPAQVPPSMKRTSSESPTRKNVPSPISSFSGLPTAFTLPAVAAGLPRAPNIEFGVSPITGSPEKFPESLPPTSAAPPAHSPSPQKSSTQNQRRALPQAPSVSPSIPLARQKSTNGPRPLERKGTMSVLQLVSKLNSGEQSTPLASSTSSFATPAAPTPVSPTKSNTIQKEAQPEPAPVPPVVQPQTSLSSESNEDEEEYMSALETGDSSHSDQKSPQYGIRDLPTRQDRLENKAQPSPQYGIRDLPTREERERGRETERKPSSVFGQKVLRKPLKDDSSSSAAGAGKDIKAMTKSPQYGIKDLPLRTKSVVERRKAWERTEQGRSEDGQPIARPATSSSAGPRSQSSSPTKASVRSSPPASKGAQDPISNSISSLTQPRVAPVHPAQSPQPQVPQQIRKYPMPAVRHPKPSRTERTPSWTLPSADLEKLASGGGEKKTSMAMKLASMSLAEEDERGPEQSGLQGLEERMTRSTGFRSSTTTTTRVRPKSQTPSAFSRTHTPSKSVPLVSHTPSRNTRVDINLDDAPPPPVRPLSRARSQSRSRSPKPPSPAIPVINIPGEAAVASPQISVSVPTINIPGETSSPTVPAIPIINVPGDDDSGPPGIIISVAPPHTPPASVPAIIEDLANAPSPSKRDLPRPPSTSTSAPTPPLINTPSGIPPNSTTSSLSTTPSTKSNLKSRGGGLACGGCGEGIIGRIVSAMGLRWHPQCFRCCTCGEHLEHVSSYEHDGKPYCHLDYHEMYAPQCFHCKTPIVDERFITLDDPALGKRTYHEQHFFCAECGDPFLAPSQESLSSSSSLASNAKGKGANINIKGDGAFDIAIDADGEEVGFTVFRGHPYCEACHVRLRAPKCKKCKRSIRDGDRAVEALGGKWCFDCFVCAGCEKPFEEPSFFQRDKKPYCETCFSIILRNEV